MSKLKPPEFSALGLGESARSKRRYVQTDVEYLSDMLSGRPWRANDVVKALKKADLLDPIFKTDEMWQLRIKWIQGEMKELTKSQWSIEKTIGLMIDAVMSYNDLQQLRAALTLEYSKEHDRCMHHRWITNPHDVNEDGTLKQKSTFVRMPEPIPPVDLVRKRFKEFEDSLKIEVSADGRIATHRFKDRLLEMHEEHLALGLIHPNCGKTRDFPHWVVYTLDGFPVEALSVEHAGIFSAMLLVASQSEEFFRIITAATIKETCAELNRMHTLRRIDHDFNSVTTKGYAKDKNGVPIYFKLLICADKKAIEMLRGCSPGCGWCTCSTDTRLSAAWPLTTPPPTTWNDAEARLRKVCKGAFPTIFDVYAWAHLALPGEELPRHCPCCNRRPYRNKEEYAEALRVTKEKRADTSKQGKAAWKAEKARHSQSHHRQGLHEAPNLLFDMLSVIPEIMHLDNLNIAKQAWTKGVLVLLNEHMRDVVTAFFKGIGAKLDVKTKADGRAGSAWFKASVWAELVHGSDKVPGGLAAWLASLLFFVGEDFVCKQGAFVPSTTGPGDARLSADEVLKRAFGLKGQQLLDCARLFDAYKDWHDATHLPTPDDVARETVALRLAITANKMMVAFKTVAKETGKTWVYHIALYMVPRTVRRCTP